MQIRIGGTCGKKISVPFQYITRLATIDRDEGKKKGKGILLPTRLFAYNSHAKFIPAIIPIYVSTNTTIRDETGIRW